MHFLSFACFVERFELLQRDGHQHHVRCIMLNLQFSVTQHVWPCARSTLCEPVGAIDAKIPAKQYRFGLLINFL